MEEILKEILNKLDSLEENMNEKFSQVNGRLDTLETKVDNLEEGQKSLETSLETFGKNVTKGFNTMNDNFDNSDKKLVELDTKSTMLLSDIKTINRKLDRQSAVSRSNSAKVKELEIRIEDMEGISPPTS
jgi:chromosome segregation ATPase